VLDPSAAELAWEEEPQKEKGNQKVQDGGEEKEPEKGGEGLSDVAPHGNQEVLGVSNRAHGASNGDGEGEREQEELGVDPMLFGQQEDHGHPYDGDGVVHDGGRKGSP